MRLPRLHRVTLYGTDLISSGGLPSITVLPMPQKPSPKRMLAQAPGNTSDPGTPAVPDSPLPCTVAQGATPAEVCWLAGHASVLYLRGIAGFSIADFDEAGQTCGI